MPFPILYFFNTYEYPMTGKKEINWVKMATIIVVSVWLLSFLLLFWTQTERGTFGDMFGAANALFSGLGMIGIVYTLYLQNRDIKDRADESIKNESQFKLELKILMQQQFDTTFYKMLELHKTLTNQMKKELRYRVNVGGGTTTRTGVLTGADLIEHEYKRFANDYVKEIRVDVKSIRIAWDQFDKQYSQGRFDSYLSNIDFICNKITSSTLLTLDEKEYYTRTLAYQLTEFELAFYFYYSVGYHNCIFNHQDHRNDLTYYANGNYLLSPTHSLLYFLNEADVKGLWWYDTATFSGYSTIVKPPDNSTPTIMVFH
jgi:hypothetical protein